jgi:mRNA interferase HigB
MRAIAVKTLKSFWEEYPKAMHGLLSWFEEVTKADWTNPNELKEQYRSASIINEKRVVFNIHGNTYRLVVDVEYRLRIIFVVWFGTHRDYDKTDIKNVRYVKTNKN